MHISISKVKSTDIQSIASIHQLTFIRQKDSYQWVGSTVAAFPRYLCYVITLNASVVGYIFWAQKSGFRSEVILELDQIAIHPDFQKKGLSKRLIQESLKLVQTELEQYQQTIKNILVNTSQENKAKKIYENVLVAKEVAVISGLFRLPEVYLKSDRDDLTFLDDIIIRTTE